MDVGVGVPGAVIRGDDGVPDYRFSCWSGGVAGGVGGGYVEEELFCVPVEEGGEVCIRSIRYCAKCMVNLPASRSNFTWAYSSRLVL